MGQLCKEFFHQQQKEPQPLNKFSNNSLLNPTTFTCRTGTKFAYGKSDPIAHPGSSPEVRWGLAQETLCLSCFHSTPSQLQRMSSPGCGSSVHAWMGGRLTQPTWERSCSWALVTPLTTKQYHSASENKICIYVTSPSSPALPSHNSRDLCYRHGATVVAWLVTSEHLLGRDHSVCPWGSQRGGGGAGVGGGVGSRTYTQPHFEAWLFRKGCSGTPWHSAGRPGLCHTAGHTQTLGRGSSVPTLILSMTSQSHQQMSGSLVVSLGARVSLSPGSWATGPRRGSHAGKGVRQGAALIAPCSS